MIKQWNLICDPGRRPGYTFIEIVVSLVVLSLISLGVAALLQTAAYGTSGQRDTRELAIRTRQVQARMEDSIRNARALLASSNNYLVLWTGDTVRNDKVNLSELQLIELANGGTSLVSYTAGTQLTDPSYTSTTDFYATAQAAKTAGTLVGQLWSTRASAMTVTLDKATPQLSRLVTWSLTLTNQSIAETVIGSAALRNPGMPQ